MIGPSSGAREFKEFSWTNGADMEIAMIFAAMALRRNEPHQTCDRAGALT